MQQESLFVQGWVEACLECRRRGGTRVKEEPEHAVGSRCKYTKIDMNGSAPINQRWEEDRAPEDENLLGRGAIQIVCLVYGLRHSIICSRESSGVICGVTGEVAPTRSRVTRLSREEWAATHTTKAASLDCASASALPRVSSALSSGGDASAPKSAADWSWSLASVASSIESWALKKRRLLFTLPLEGEIKKLTLLRLNWTVKRSDPS
ncbi:hypothetical protein DFH09DRAFT_1110569 [Mycena vulgaris]|nr:hypothetical protein DFH09DRAFT_1110569 [Mycena vulgaris]